MNQEKNENSVVISSGNNQIAGVDMFDPLQSKNALMVASTIAASNLIPYHYQHKPENVFVALYRSKRLDVDPFAYMETTYVIGGKIAHEAKFIVALINKSKKFKGVIRYEMSGEIKRDKNLLVSTESTRKCTAWAIDKETGDKLEQSIDIQMAFLEGWATKLGADKTLKTNKWHTMPDIMLQYRAAKFFGNMFCPELVMGLATKEELEDISDAETIEQAETGKNIFEKGEDVNTTAEPVLDPAKEIRPEPVVATVVETNQESVHEKIHETEAIPVAEVVSPESLPENPPEDIKEFAAWFGLKFAKESSEVDAFLVSKKWLKMGEGFPALSEAQLTKLRGMWDKFLISYKTFKDAK